MRLIPAPLWRNCGVCSALPPNIRTMSGRSLTILVVQVSAMSLPLTALRVLDLSRVLSGPYCTMLLADMGAEVIKVEVPGEGDLTRGQGDPESEARGGQPVFFDLNRNKKSLTLNLKTDAGKEIFKRFVETTDVLVENYRPDAMDRLGLGYSVLSQINPRLIYCGISGFGKTGPYSLWPAYDQIAQGMSGLMSVTGDGNCAPMRVGSPSPIPSPDYLWRAGFYWLWHIVSTPVRARKFKPTCWMGSSACSPHAPRISWRTASWFHRWAITSMISARLGLSKRKTGILILPPGRMRHFVDCV